jgi:hypothetical protein
MSDFCLNYASKTKSFIFDGTFYSVPNNFMQLISIQSSIFGRYVPLGYALLQSKSKNCYIEFFKHLKSIGIFPNNIIIDFEKGLISSLKYTYQGVDIFGCSFHYGQNIWRRMQFLGIVKATKKI